MKDRPIARVLLVGVVAACVLVFAVPEVLYWSKESSVADVELLSETDGSLPLLAAAAAAINAEQVESDPLYAWTVLSRLVFRRQSPSLPQALAYKIASCQMVNRRSPLERPTAVNRLVLAMWLTRHQSSSQMVSTLLDVCVLSSSSETYRAFGVRVFGHAADSWGADDASLIAAIAFSPRQLDPSCRPSEVVEAYVQVRSRLCARAGCADAPKQFHFGRCNAADAGGD